MDYTIKLWSMQSSSPLHTFRNNFDYVMDIAWSPLYPGVFVAIDASGSLDIYNLNENPEEPLKSLSLKDNKAINRVAWNMNGQQLCTGTENGEIYVYNVSDELTNPSQEDWDHFYNVTLNYQAENYKNYDD